MRPSKESYFISMAVLASSRATCPRRKVGCILVNWRGHVLATGYNGSAAGEPHCIDTPCAGACHASGQGLDCCQALHAEQNALLQCKDTDMITTAYVTDSPCVTCVKMLMNTLCTEIVFLREYPHPEAKALWTARNGRKWTQYEGPLVDLDEIVKYRRES